MDRRDRFAAAIVVLGASIATRYARFNKRLNDDVRQDELIEHGYGAGHRG